MRASGCDLRFSTAEKTRSRSDRLCQLERRHENSKRSLLVGSLNKTHEGPTGRGRFKDTREANSVRSEPVESEVASRGGRGNSEFFFRRSWLLNRRDHTHGSAASLAYQNVNAEDALEQRRPGNNFSVVDEARVAGPVHLACEAFGPEHGGIQRVGRPAKERSAGAIWQPGRESRDSG